MEMSTGLPSVSPDRDSVPLWCCGSCRSTNTRFVRTSADFDEPERPPEVDILCLDCGAESVGFSVSEKELTEMRDLLQKAGSPVSEDADVETVIRALFSLAKKNGEEHKPFVLR